MRKLSIIIVDDNRYILRSFSTFVKLRGHISHTAENGKEALDLLSAKKIDVVLTEMRMPEMDGMELLKKIKNDYPDTDVIVITGYGSIDDAVKAMKYGATDYILKPFSLDEVILKMQDSYNMRIGVEKPYSGNIKIDYHVPRVIAETSEMKNILDEINIVAPTNATVLITGETGVGKDVIARLLHSKSERRKKPFIRMNCVELNEGVIESELFGHEKGSFTGAVSTKKGRLELADNGSLFLDEIGDIPPSTQKKLLRVLEQKEFERVGGTETITIDVRVIAATNKNLPFEVKKKRFRQDLFYRLNTVTINIPSLKERKNDIIPLARHFLTTFTKDQNTVRMTKEIKNMFLSYTWPGNVRELKSTIERAVIFSENGDINLKRLFSEKDYFAEQAGIFTLECPSLKIDDVEKSLLLKVLEDSQWNIQQSARILKISRTTLYDKIQKHDLYSNRQKPEKFKEEG